MGGVDEVPGLTRMNTRTMNDGGRGTGRAFCKGSREMGWPLEEGILSSKAVWFVWVFSKQTIFPNERNNSLLVSCKIIDVREKGQLVEGRGQRRQALGLSRGPQG